MSEAQTIGTLVEDVEEDLNQLTFGKIMDGVLTLPGGVIDSEGNLHKVVKLREMTGEEEDILISNSVKGHEKIDKVLSNCVTQLGDISDRKSIELQVRRMTVGDRVVLLMAVRSLSLGSEYSFSSQCDNCGAKNDHEVDLLELDVKEAPDPKLREQTLTLPSGRKATLAVMTGEGEARIAKATRGKKRGDVLSLNIMARLVELDGAPAGVKTVKKLTTRDRKAIRQWFRANEGGVDTSLELSCDSCDSEYESVLDAGQPDFFFPKDSE
jgi:hypothetical protein